MCQLFITFTHSTKLQDLAQPFLIISPSSATSTLQSHHQAWLIATLPILTVPIHMPLLLYLPHYVEFVYISVPPAKL